MIGTVPQPISDEDAERLYDAIFVGLGQGAEPIVTRCDNKLTHAAAWALANNMDFPAIKAWLEDNGGFCDCEVLWNVMPYDDDEEE